jgi:hypothetical protein
MNATLPIVKSTPFAAPPACSPLMTPVQFRLDTEVFGCCTVGVPLDQTMKNILTKPCGFFIEAGAQDGMFQSNTLIFARKFGYTGLLVEPATSLIRALTSNRPESIVFNGALTSITRAASACGSTPPPIATFCSSTVIPATATRHQSTRTPSTLPAIQMTQ